MDLVSAGLWLTLGKQLLWKTFDLVSEDIAKLYEKGRNKIIEKATKKIVDKADGKSANLRVARDVFFNGSFTDEAICAEYFWGILASSRSESWTEDIWVYYVDIIKSLSSTQLKLHYCIYHIFNNYFVSDTSKHSINCGQANELSAIKIYSALMELIEISGSDDIWRDLHAISSKWLIANFQTGNEEIIEQDSKSSVPHVFIAPTPLWVQLYAVAHNKLDARRDFPRVDFWDFEGITPPQYRGSDVSQILEKAWINKSITES